MNQGKDTKVVRLLLSLIKHRRPKDMRRIIYDRTKEEKEGQVPCFVCGHHVQWKEATLEHIIPKHQGGTDVEYNLAISHSKCNNLKGSVVTLGGES